MSEFWQGFVVASLIWFAVEVLEFALWSKILRELGEIQRTLRLTIAHLSNRRKEG